MISDFDVNRNPKVSIVIACYNDPDIGTAIHSAYSQSYNNKEIIVVNDGSDVSSSKLMEELSDIIDVYLVQENQGQSVARNYGIERASGEYILNLDSDDSFESSFCDKAVLRFQNDKNIKIVTCKAIRFDSNGEIDEFTPRGGKIKDFLYSNSALGSAMFRKIDWEQVGGYEENLAVLGFEDWEFYIRLLKNGGYADVIKEPLFNYRLRENSTTQRIRRLRMDKFEFIILKHADLYQQNFEDLVKHLINRIKKEEAEKIQKLQQVEFKLGYQILRPLRKIKSIFKNQ